MVDSHLVEQRLLSIRQRLVRIAEKRPPDEGSFLADRDAQELVAFNLLLAFQDALDLAAQVIAAQGWELPTTAREHYAILERHGALSPPVAGAMAGCAGLRNLIAHTYGNVDHARLYAELPKGEAALEAFMGEVSAYTSPD